MEKETDFLIIFHMVIFDKKRYDFYIFLRGHEASHLVIVENRLGGNRLNKEKYRFLVVLSLENSDAQPFKVSIQYESQRQFRKNYLSHHSNQ